MSTRWSVVIGPFVISRTAPWRNWKMYGWTGERRKDASSQVVKDKIQAEFHNAALHVVRRPELFMDFW